MHIQSYSHHSVDVLLESSKSSSNLSYWHSFGHNIVCSVCLFNLVACCTVKIYFTLLLTTVWAQSWFNARDEHSHEGVFKKPGEARTQSHYVLCACCTPVWKPKENGDEIVARESITFTFLCTWRYFAFIETLLVASLLYKNDILTRSYIWYTKALPGRWLRWRIAVKYLYRLQALFPNSSMDKLLSFQ